MESATRPATADGWSVFDGCHTIVDTGHATSAQAETAATDWRDRHDTDGELYETYVAYAEPCSCWDGCGSCDDGVVVTDQQPWRSNQPETVQAAA